MIVYIYIGTNNCYLWFQSEDSTVPEYMRWIQQKSLKGPENVITEEEGEGEDMRQVTQSMDDGLLLLSAHKRQPYEKQKYLFLTDRDTETRGRFSEKYKGAQENKNIPQPYRGDMPKSYSALGGMISATPDPSKSGKFSDYNVSDGNKWFDLSKCFDIIHTLHILTTLRKLFDHSI